MATTTTSQNTNLIDFINEAIKQFNDEIAQGGPLTIGPRPLRFNESLDGAAITPGRRTFISEVLTSDSVDLKLTKKGGKAATVVSVFKTKDNQTVPLGALNFAAGRSNVDQTQSQSLSGLRGHILTVLVDPSGFPGTKFVYELVASSK